ncbi:hypothetical protein JCM24511_01538 [Saitozyma sp. JCM 24511]|nr:hypothetical protein JCM24511_01538 [Saitozyma sp. JCM 24511]
MRVGSEWKGWRGGGVEGWRDKTRTATVWDGDAVIGRIADKVPKSLPTPSPSRTPALPGRNRDARGGSWVVMRPVVSI